MLALVWSPKLRYAAVSVATGRMRVLAAVSALLMLPMLVVVYLHASRG